MRKRRNKKGKRIVLGVILLCILAVGAVYWRYDHYFYMLGEYVGISCEEIKLEKAEDFSVVPYTLDELQTNDRIEWNQSMMLVNTEYRLEDVYVPVISQYKDTGVYMNDCIKASYQELSSAVTEETGSKLFVSSDFRTAEKQQELYEEDSSTATETGASEHQTGLAMDVYVSGYAGDGFIQSKAGRFVNSYSWEYGFIIRYPVFGEAETGIRYEPWHIRYVGQPHAKIIYNNHMTLEEYIRSLESDEWYEADGYYISRQTASGDGTLSLPEEFDDVVISEDNTGSYIVTLRMFAESEN